VAHRTLEGRWNQVAPKDGGTVRTREDVPASCRGRQSSKRDGVWDAVIVDEAHNGRKGSSFYSMLERLRDHTQTYYLLTATPMQLHAGELYDLMSLLDLPGEWDNQDDFEKFFETRRALSAALEKKLDGDDATDDDSWSAQATLTENRYQDRLTGERSISDRVLDALGEELEIKTSNRHERLPSNESSAPVTSQVIMANITTDTLRVSRGRWMSTISIGSKRRKMRS